MSSPSKTTGQKNSMLGSVKETVGNIFGARDMAQRGREQHAAGEGEIKAAKAQGYVEGTSDRVVGKKDSVVGAVTGDKTQQTAGNARQEKGERKQEWNK
ncbi:hypothetical protein M407DRAFT_86612 [Tulasnella calospora MUT 4182]|uniref:CsbD-like domain-containing protein n=1 Tax=Tulasnella calospora MUT 4182 TaxID=1051891 RepID=A0A0C3PNF7_9AGAM|nr:hypothetical protein M407DRAFT_86612 [Tulasnella calospora MUT 4182]